MACRSCASKATNIQPGLAAKLGINFTGVKGKNASRRDAFVEWVAAANGLWREILPGAVVETSESRKADIFNRTDKERNICGQAVILKDGRCGQIVTVAKLGDGKENVAFFRQRGNRSSKGIDNCESLRLKTAFAALKRAQEQRNSKTCLPGTYAAAVDESDDDLSETITMAEHDDSDAGGDGDETHAANVKRPRNWRDSEEEVAGEEEEESFEGQNALPPGDDEGLLIRIVAPASEEAEPGGDGDETHAAQVKRPRNRQVAR